MANHVIIFSSLITFFLSCTIKDENTKNSMHKDTLSHTITFKISDTIKTPNYFKSEGDSIVVLPFEITITLSAKAKDRIIKSNETIIVNASLTGLPKDKRLISEDGEFYVASSEKEISYGQAAKFDNIKFSRKTYNQLLSKDVYLNVFFSSGRKSSKDNLLDGNILSDKISNVVNKRFNLTGKLIYGDD